MRNLEALNRLFSIAAATPEEKLNMRSFSGQEECGTVYCLFGLACVDPWFQQNTRINEYLFPNPEHDGRLDVTDTFFDFGRRMDAHKFIADIFGLSVEDSDNLFAMRGYVYNHIPKGEVLANLSRAIRGEPTYQYSGVRHA
jgi:hypothetical protein